MDSSSSRQILIQTMSQCARVQSPVAWLMHDGPTNWPVCECPTIKLSIQAVTTVTNHDQFYNEHAWMDT